MTKKQQMKTNTDITDISVLWDAVKGKSVDLEFRLFCPTDEGFLYCRGF